MNGAQWLVRTLQNRGVEQIFALHGNGLFPFLDAFVEADIQVIDVRNEQAAAYMADAWAAMTRKLGVVVVSSGPGHTNALTGLANAWWDGRPVLLISGSSPQSGEGADTFQELDQVGMAAPVCKFATKVHHIEALSRQVENALSVAVSGRPGPVHLTIPHDVFIGEMDESQRVRERIGLAQAQPTGAGDKELVRQAVQTLANAKRPFAIIGSGCYYAGAWEPLKAFCQTAHIPMLSSIWDRGCVEEPISEYVGPTRSAELTNGALARLAEADVVLTLGARIDFRVGQGLPTAFPQNARIIRVDADPVEINRNLIAEIAIVGDPRTVLEQMLDEADSYHWDHDTWLADVRASRQALIDHWEPLAREDTWPLPALRICREIKPFLDRDITFLLDGGSIGQWAHMALFDRNPAHWLTCGISGAVGWGLSGAIGAKLARPRQPLLLLSGDGAAGFNITEIETALRFHTPYVAVVACDNAWGIVADGQPANRRIASQFGEIRYDRVAQAFGARGVYIEHPNQLAPAIEVGLAANTVTVIHTPVQLASIHSWEERFG